MWRWWLPSPDISSILYLHIFDVFHGTLSFGAGGQMSAFVPWALRTMGLFVFHPRTFAHMSGLD